MVSGGAGWFQKRLSENRGGGGFKEVCMNLGKEVSGGFRKD